MSFSLVKVAVENDHPGVFLFLKKKGGAQKCLFPHRKSPRKIHQSVSLLPSGLDETNFAQRLGDQDGRMEYSEGV